jgi:ring-1,2-phenylacetyl-CoA epoxidase subunit PaaD
MTEGLEKQVWTWLNEVKDPEVPVISITDLGIVRKVQGGKSDDPFQEVTVVITPTYAGCPAMDVIAMQVRMLLLEKGFKQVNIERQISPAWTTEWMTQKGKDELLAYGIAPPLPVQQVCTPDDFVLEEAVACPRCRSLHTKQVSRFGSTACKALYQCEECKEPFDYFKCH